MKFYLHIIDVQKGIQIICIHSVSLSWTVFLCNQTRKHNYLEFQKFGPLLLVKLYVITIQTLTSPYHQWDSSTFKLHVNWIVHCCFICQLSAYDTHSFKNLWFGRLRSVWSEAIAYHATTDIPVQHLWSWNIYIYLETYLGMQRLVHSIHKFDLSRRCLVSQLLGWFQFFLAVCESIIYQYR